MDQDFNGFISIEIDKKALSVRLRFKPDRNGETCNLEIVRNLLQKENIVYGVNDVAVKDAVNEFFDAIEETLSDPIAEGDEPNSGEGDVYDFSPMFVSPSLQPVADKIRSMDRAPQIYETIKTTVQRDKRVKDKGLFKGNKEKIITVEETVEKKIPVQVSNEIKHLGYFRKDDLICTMMHSEGEEKAGKNVFGETIQPLPVSREKYLCGKNIRQDKSEFFAEKDGFVRVGDNWMDLFLFSVHHWDVRVSDDKADCLLSIAPGHKASPLPKLEEIKAEIEKLGFSSDHLLNDVQIQKFIKYACLGEVEKTFCLTNDQDSEFNIEINSLATEAYLELKKGSGNGKKLDLKKIWAKVVSLNIKNFDAEKVKRAILDFNASNEISTSILLGKGEIPERGKDRELIVDTEYLPADEVQSILERMKHLKKKPESFEDFPMEDIEKMALVKKGSQIFHLGAINDGKKGLDVFGNSIPGIDGNDPVVRLYENIIIQEGKALAAIDGILDYSSKKSVYSLRVRKHKDAQILITVAENNMKATMSVIPPEGSGNLPTKESLMDELEDKGVVAGVSDQALNSILEQTGKEELVTEVTVAQSFLPFRESKALKFLLEIDTDKKNSIPVEAGDRIAEIISASQEVTPGLNVLGERILDENQKLEIDANIKEEVLEEGNFLVAVQKGLLVFEGSKLFINNKHVFNGDLSRNQGNIQFPGTVEIIGSVLSGVYINAGNDLKVRDVVEAALLSANGSILIGKGIKGDRKAVVRSNKNINLGFAENSNLMSIGNITFKKAFMNCHIKCNGKIIAQSDDTKIIGGVIKTKSGLTAGHIGSERGVPTFISFGQDYLVEDQINVMTKEIEQINDQLKSLEDMMNLAERKNQKNKLFAIRKKKVQLLKVQEKKVVKNFLMKDKFEIHFESEIRINGTLFAGTIFESHGRKLEIKENLTSVVVSFDSSSGKITTKKI